MYDVGSLSEIQRFQRAEGAVRLSVRQREGRSVLKGLYQQGSAKARLPKTYSPSLEAVLLNTAGGITGGDHLSYELEAEEDAHLVATTQAAEKVYRSLGDSGRLDVTLKLAAGARCDWLPQETIFYNGGSLRRSLTVEMAADARLLAVEPLIFGRRAMGERLLDGFLSDQWRIRREGRLVYAEAFRVAEKGGEALARREALRGWTAAASLVYLAPDAEARLEEARTLLEPLVWLECGASAWDGILALRFLAETGAQLRRALIAFLEPFLGAPLPRVWQS
jgi:urease accessory protein